MGMKVIFLDIDGVLNCKKTPNPRKLPYIVDPELLERFESLLEPHGCEGSSVIDMAIRSCGSLQRQTLGYPFRRGHS